MWQRWTIEQQRSFDLRAEVITRWVDYFVSYTNRDAGQTNNQFRRLIKSAFGAFPPEPDRLNYNYVARVIAKYLDSNNLRGFTDAHNIKSGDEIEAKVFNYCKKAFTFTQVLERESFKAPPAPKRNWCYDEYQEFVSPRTELTAFQVANQTKVFTVIGAKTIDTLKPAVLGVFANWYDAIAGLKHISLEGMTNTELSSKIDEVAVLILERKRAIIDSLLAA
jgi:hypothetical protein